MQRVAGRFILGDNPARDESFQDPFNSGADFVGIPNLIRAHFYQAPATVTADSTTTDAPAVAVDMSAVENVSHTVDLSSESSHAALAALHDLVFGGASAETASGNPFLNAAQSHALDALLLHAEGMIYMSPLLAAPVLHPYIGAGGLTVAKIIGDV